MSRFGILFLAVYSGLALGAGEHGGPDALSSRPEAPAGYRLIGFADFKKEIDQIKKDLEIPPNGFSRNCGIPYPFRDEELRQLGFDPPNQKTGSPALAPATQYRILTGWRNVAKVARAKGLTFKGRGEICIGPETAGPALGGELVVAWNATPAQLEAAFARMLTKEQREALARKVKEKSASIFAKYGIQISATNGRYFSHPGAPADKVLALLDAVDRALAKKNVYGKKIDAIFLELNASDQKLAYVDESINKGNTFNSTTTKMDSGLVSLNARLIEPSEVEALLASSTISDLPVEQTFADIEKLLGQTADPLLRQRLQIAKKEFSEFRTPDRREMNKLIARIGKVSDVGFLGGNDDPRIEIPLLKRLAALPPGELRLPAEKVRTTFDLPYPLAVPGGSPNDNRWHFVTGCNDFARTCGAIRLTADATPEQIREGLKSIPSRAALDTLIDELKKNTARATAALGKHGVTISDVDGQRMTFEQTQKRSRLLGELATCFRGAKPQGAGKDVKSIIFRIRPSDEGARVWLDKSYTGALSIQVDATSGELKDYVNGCGE